MANNLLPQYPMQVQFNGSVASLNQRTGTVRLHSRKAPALPVGVAYAALSKADARRLRKALHKLGQRKLAAVRAAI